MRRTRARSVSTVITARFPESIRRQIAFVGQDVFLFHGNIRNNIGLARPGASEDEIITTARAAHADEFISQFAAAPW